MPSLQTSHTPLPHVKPGSRVLVVSGSYGAGHDMAAAQIRGRLTEIGCSVTVIDVVDMFPWGVGPVSRAAYLAQIRWAPRSWELLLDSLERRHGEARLAERLLGLATPALLAAARGHDTVISTHPFPAQALGPARRDGRLRATLLTYLTDMSVHRLWVHDGVDLHLALHEVAAQQARRHGGRTVVVDPLLPDLTAVSPFSRARPLPTSHPYALVCGGSLGIGELAATARDLVSIGRLTPVVLCGTNEHLRRRLGRRDGVIALGWRDDISSLMAGAALVIANSGGFMTKEALAVGAPLVSYRCLPGHGVANASAIEAAGHGGYARNRDDFARVVLAAAGAVPRPLTAARQPQSDA